MNVQILSFPLSLLQGSGLVNLTHVQKSRLHAFCCDVLGMGQQSTNNLRKLINHYDTNSVISA
jgi:hypothetical protein